MPTRPSSPLSSLIFASRWLQMPLYLGLIVAQAVYVFHFFVELYHLVMAAFGSQPDIEALIRNVGYKYEFAAQGLNETVIMLVVLRYRQGIMGDRELNLGLFKPRRKQEEKHG